jgi:hypothetical protein
MSQSRGSCLDTGRSIKSPRLLEIKTSHNFGHKEIIHVLVPEHLMELLPRQFTEAFDGKLISIPFTEKMVPINKIPQILEVLHGESIPSGSLDCSLPDYETALTRIAGAIPEFSLHAVRLHTPFDYAPRYIANLSVSAKLLSAAHAHTLKEYPNGSGWVLVHKTKMVNIPLEKRCGVSMSACLDPRAIREAIIAARQPMSMSFYHQRLSLQQLRGLCCLNDTTALVIDYSNPISPIVSEPVTMLSFPEKLKVTIGDLEQLAKLGSIAEAEERELKARAEAEARKLEAIKTIQACIRTRIAMANFETYRVAKKECEDSAKEVQLIEESLRLAQAKAEKARAKLAKAKDAIEKHTIEAAVVPSTTVVAEHSATVVEHSEQVGVDLGELPKTTRRSTVF